MGDAFYPELYPDLVSSNRFIVDLLYIPVQTADGAVDTTYLQYMLRHQQKNPYLYPFLWTLQKAKSLFEEPLPPVSAARRLDPKRLNRREDQLVNKVRQLISCDVDIKTNVITLVVKDQDPLVCVTVADSVRERLQEFITSYRTSKARIDDAVCMTAERHARDPVVEYLNGLERDGTERLDTLFIAYLRAEDNRYTRAVTRKVFTAAVARAYQPGTKFDQVVITSGAQGA